MAGNDSCHRPACQLVKVDKGTESCFLEKESEKKYDREELIHCMLTATDLHLFAGDRKKWSLVRRLVQRCPTVSNDKVSVLSYSSYGMLTPLD